MAREEERAEPKKKGFWGLLWTQGSANKGRKLVCGPLFHAFDGSSD